RPPASTTTSRPPSRKPSPPRSPKRRRPTSVRGVSTPPPTTNTAPRIRRVTLTTARMADEQAWWTGRLGLQPALGAPAGGFAVQVGDGVLAFQPVAEARHGRGAEP